jgi:hypothetical protein
MKLDIRINGEQSLELFELILVGRGKNDLVRATHFSGITQLLLIENFV